MYEFLNLSQACRRWPIPTILTSYPPVIVYAKRFAARGDPALLLLLLEMEKKEKKSN